MQLKSNVNIAKSVIAVSPPTSRKKTSRAKSNSCKTNIRQQKLLKTSVLDLTSSEKVLRPFWNTACRVGSRKFILPTETVSEDLPSTLLDGLSNELVAKSWFSTRLSFHRNKNLPQIYSQSSTYFRADFMDLEVTKARLNKLYPTTRNRKEFKTWLDVSRYVYNQSIAFLRSCIAFIPSWMELRKYVLSILPAFCRAVPYQIKTGAVKDAHKAFIATITAKRTKWSGFSFRSRKMPEQSCYIPKSAVGQSGIYYTMSGKGLRYSEDLKNECDCRLLWKYNDYYLVTPYKETILRSENQARRMVALDPGVRNFMSFYSPHVSGNIGTDASEKIFKICKSIDKLVSMIDLTGSNRKKKSYRVARKRLQRRLTNMVTELHYKTANFLVKNFDVIFLPTFETHEMSARLKRKINNKVVRNMMNLSFYKFRQRLEWLCVKHGKTLVLNTEEYTSKTHPQTGKINHKLGSAKRVVLSDGSRANRDIVGAFNFFMKTLLVDTPRVIGKLYRSISV